MRRDKKCNNLRTGIVKKLREGDEVEKPFSGFNVDDEKVDT